MNLKEKNEFNFKNDWLSEPRTGGGVKLFWMSILIIGLSLAASDLFACPSGQSCPAGKDCVADSSLCVADSSSSSSTSTEPTTVKDQLGLTLDLDQPFVSYENVNDLTIVEPQTFGLDVDTNYWVIKVGIGGALSVGSGQSSLNLSLPLGYQQLQDTQNASIPEESAWISGRGVTPKF